MFRFLKRRNAAPDGASPERRLIAELEALDPARLDAAALELERLWAWFTDQFGGTAPFLEKPASEQDAYLDRLNQAVTRSESLKDSELGRFYYSSAILKLFVTGLRSGDSSPDVLALSARVAWMLNHARQLNAEQTS